MSEYWSNAWQNFKDTNASTANTIASFVTTTIAETGASVIMDASVGGSVTSGLSAGSKAGVIIARQIALTSKSTLIWEAGTAAGSLINAMNVPGSEGTIRDWWSNWFYDNKGFWDSPGSWLYDYLNPC